MKNTHSQQGSKTIFITGCSSGIGRATAMLFQQKGWNVFATMRKPEDEQELHTLPHTYCAQLDVTNLPSIKKAISLCLEKFGRIDVVVNNAGYGLVGPFEELTPEQIQNQFDTNVFGVMNVTREILPYYRQKNAGMIMNVASMGGRITFPLYSVYHSTKWAVEGFSESLQHELKDFNIQVKIIEPGVIKTDFYTRSAKKPTLSSSSAYLHFFDRTMPQMSNSGKSGSSSEDVAKVIYSAATHNSNRLRYIAGWDAKMLLFLRAILPDSLFNWITYNAVVKKKTQLG